MNCVPFPRRNSWYCTHYIAEFLSKGATFPTCSWGGRYLAGWTNWSVCDTSGNSYKDGTINTVLFMVTPPKTTMDTQKLPKYIMVWKKVTPFTHGNLFYLYQISGVYLSSFRSPFYVSRLSSAFILYLQGTNFWPPKLQSSPGNLTIFRLRDPLCFSCSIWRNLKIQKRDEMRRNWTCAGTCSRITNAYLFIIYIALSNQGSVFLILPNNDQSF